jgi:hypothetical protein
MESKTENRKRKQIRKKGKELTWPKPTKLAHQQPAHDSPASIPLRFRGGSYLLPRLSRMDATAPTSSTATLQIRSTPDAPTSQNPIEDHPRPCQSIRSDSYHNTCTHRRHIRAIAGGEIPMQTSPRAIKLFGAPQGNPITPLPPLVLPSSPYLS